LTDGAISRFDRLDRILERDFILQLVYSLVGVPEIATGDG
jgi:hypothetical protein